MIYLFPLPGEAPPSRSQSTAELKAKAPTALSRPDAGKNMMARIPVRSTVEEDQVDIILHGLNGTIERKRDPKK